VVIDSITFHFRHDFDDYMARTRVLTSMAQTLMSLADEFRLAVPPLISVPHSACSFSTTFARLRV